MAGYVWSINNVAWNKDTPPLAVAEGERVELVFVNETPMPHPMHLHGHEFQVVEIDGDRFSGAVRDTVLVTPGRRVVVAFDAVESGLVGAPLPSALPPGGGHVHHDQVRVRRRERSIWVFLARGRFVTKDPDYAGWILLDFLGFSRPNRDLSIGYKGFSVKNFSSRFFPSIRSVSMGNAQSRRRGRQDCSGASLFQFLIFCKDCRGRGRRPAHPKAIALRSKPNSLHWFRPSLDIPSRPI